ncbi:heme biosynthesis protein HemY [Salibaculum sp.]|uniref:heme biosynthesis protein HemY n=1 Tax=Salibaculum sp. TaxID=2855480 RepID=UPI002B4685F3|nr:heme biosynthesis HemY N-terminal domain-containing protein [Salibaculum sp.]HKL68146.1 heme biosynthesis HemY N-terminal domain-containing protein [Salibaculum sp.]
MIWSLVKILAFVVLVTALTYGGVLLMEVPGEVVIDVAGFSMTMSVLELVVVLGLLIALVWLGFKLAGLLVASFKFLNGDETAISRYFSRNRERKGFDALSEGMMALASGEGQLAMTKASRAEKYLGKPHLTNLLAAQAAEMAGDRKMAERTYRKLLEDERTRFVGVRGIMKQKLSDGDTDTAMKLAEKAFALKPRHEETQDTLLRLQAETADWNGARETLGIKLKTGTLPRDVHTRRDAVLALSQASEMLEKGEEAKAQETILEANRLSPELIPAAVMASKVHVDKGNTRAASRLIKKTWGSHPHPDLARAFAAIAPEEDPQARIKRFKPVLKVRPEDPETRMLLAELHIAAEDFPEARRALGDLIETDPTARSLTLMAAIERGEGKPDTVVRGWLTKALTAPRGPQWICDKCHTIHADWVPVCTNCKAFDTLTWRRPPVGEVAMPGGTEMLPLIVGQLDSTASTQTKPAEDAELIEDTTEVATKPEK